MQVLKRLVISLFQMNFPSVISDHKRIVSAAVCALLAPGIFLAACREPRTLLSPDITTPALAAGTLDPQSLYFTISARDYLLKKKPEWISSRDSASDRRDFMRAEADPAAWRLLDHKYHFDALLLCGDPGEYRRLLQYLLQAKDWTLTYLDHTSLIFKRSPAKPWTVEDFNALQQKFANYPKADRAMYLMETGAKLLAVGQYGMAKQQLDASLALDSKSAETWAQLAYYELVNTHYDKAMDDVGRALSLEKDNGHALALKAQIYYATRRFNDALLVSQELVKATPDDQNVLFFHAKIAHEAHAYDQEILTLKHLLEIVEKEHQPTAGFHIYLAQAYARKDEISAALEEFQNALNAGDLSDEQIKYINESMTTLKSRPSQ